MRCLGREQLIAITAALTAIYSITAGTAPAAAQSGKYKDAPALGEQVKAGKLPPGEPPLSLPYEALLLRRLGTDVRRLTAGGR